MAARGTVGFSTESARNFGRSIFFAPDIAAIVEFNMLRVSRIAIWHHSGTPAESREKHGTLEIVSQNQTPLNKRLHFKTSLARWSARRIVPGRVHNVARFATTYATNLQKFVNSKNAHANLGSTQPGLSRDR